MMAALALLLPAPVLAQPPVMAVYGAATIDGVRAADGTEVTAIIDGQVVSRTTVSSGSYNMNIVQPSGANYWGKTVTFTVGGARAQQATVWEAGLNLNLDLTATTRVPGDINGDGKVDVVDLAILGSVWGLRQGSAGFDARADLDGNGDIGLPDLAILASNYGKGSQ